MRWKAAAVVALLLALAPSAYLAWTWREMPQLGLYHDDSIYWVTARSLAFGNGYRIESLPGQPAETKYPPLYPLLLSAVWRIHPDFPANLKLAMLLSWLLLPLYLLVARQVFAGFGMNPVAAWLLCALMALNPVLALFSLTLMSELPFAILLALALLLAERASKSETGPWLAAAAGLCAGLAYLTRSAALPLLVTAPLCFLLRRQLSKAVWFAAAMAPAVAAWQLWVRAHKARDWDLVTLFYTNYLGYHLENVSWGNLLRVLEVNATYLFTAIGKLIVFSAGESFGYTMLVRLVTAGAVIGAVRLARRTGSWHFALYGAAYALLLLLWHYPPDARFVLPLLPLVMAGFAAELGHLLGIVRTATRKPKRTDRAAAFAVSAALALFSGSVVWQAWHGLTRFLPAVFEQRRNLLAGSRGAYDWIARNSLPESRCLAYGDPLLYLYSGRRAWSLRVPPKLLYQADPRGIEEFVTATPGFARRLHTDYIFATNVDFQLESLGVALPAWQRLLRENPSFRLHYQSPHAAVYRFDPR